MTAPDTAPVLPFPPPKKRPPRKDSKDSLTRAMAALQSALEAELYKPTPEPDRPEQTEDPFSPIGSPTWRAGKNDAPDRRSGRAGAAARAVAPHGIKHGPKTDKDPLARRITAIHLPRFAMERWQKWAAQQPDTPPEDLPLALAVEGHHGPTVHAANRAAELAGVHLDMRVVDARALIPELRVEYADTRGDAAALQRLMLWCRRWCPWTAVDGSEGLVLDTTGSDHLWGGEAAMLRMMEEDLSRLGFSANLATAPTHGAAWALSRFGPVRSIAQPEQLAQTVAPLPTRALRLDADTVLLLKRLGLKTIGDLAAVPRISLARRFSRAALAQNPLIRMDQLMGRLAEPLEAPDDPPAFAVQSKLPEPVQDPTPHLPALCEELCKGMTKAGVGARRITVTVYRTDGEVRHVTAATALASRDPAHLTRLFDGKLEAIDPGFGFDLITLGATVIEEVAVKQTKLDGSVDDGAELARLVDRLSARLGPRAVTAQGTLQSHIPERTIGARPAITGPPPAPLTRGNRPILIFDSPEEIRVVYAVPEGPPAQFIWRRLTHKVVRFAGPERIAPEWWRDCPGTRLRDYYRIEDQTYRRLWIYRDGVMGDGRGTTPRWFLHGLFS